MPSNSVRCACPKCRRAFSTTEKIIGKRVTCPKCRTPFTVQAIEEQAVPVLELAETEDEPANRKRASSLGLFIYSQVKGCLLLIAIVLFLILIGLLWHYLGPTMIVVR